LEDLIFKITSEKWTGSVAQAIEHLLCKHEAQSSNPSSTKQTNKNQLTFKEYFILIKLLITNPRK
jgi:hypothetical protein